MERKSMFVATSVSDCLRVVLSCLMSVFIIPSQCSWIWKYWHWNLPEKVSFDCSRKKIYWNVLSSTDKSWDDLLFRTLAHITQVPMTRRDFITRLHEPSADAFLTSVPRRYRRRWPADNIEKWGRAYYIYHYVLQIILMCSQGRRTVSAVHPQ